MIPQRGGLGAADHRAERRTLLPAGPLPFLSRSNGAEAMKNLSFDKETTARAPESKAGPRRFPVRYVAGERLRELRLIQQLTPQEYALQHPLEERGLEAHVLWARRRGLSLEQVKQAAAEEYADLVGALRECYESGDRKALGEIVAGERPEDPWPMLLEEPWYKTALLKARRPLPVIGGGRYLDPAVPVTEKPARQQQQSRVRKKRFDDRVRVAIKKLKKKVADEIQKLPRSLWRDPQKLQAARRAIKDNVLAQACASADATERKAGKTAKAQRERQLSFLQR